MVPDLICAHYTVAGDVQPGVQDVSPHPLRQRVEAVAAAGYRGFGFSFADLQHALSRQSAHEIDLMLSDLGMVHRGLEVLSDWFADDERRAAFEARRDAMLEVAAQLRIRTIKVGGDRTGRSWPSAHMAERFAELCDAAAAAAGTAITIELAPSSNLCGLEIGRQVIDGAGRANGGLLLDIWSIMRGPIDLDEVAAAPPGLVNYVELSDGPLRPQGTTLPETLNARLAPGEGEFPLGRFIAALRRCGYAGPYGIEIMSPLFRSLPPADAADRSYRGAAAMFEAT